MIAALLAPLVLALDSPTPRAPAQFVPQVVGSGTGWELSITPHSPDGLHGAEYVMMKTPGISGASKSEMWKGRRDYTLRDPIVSDRGWTYGWALVDSASDALREPDMLCIIIVDASGKAVVNEKLPRQDQRGPWITSWLLFEEHGAVVIQVRLDTSTGPAFELWTYDLQTGKRISNFQPFISKFDDTGYKTEYTVIVGAHVVNSTPLVLSHGVTRLSDAPGVWSGARDVWALHDLSGQLIWSLTDDKDPAIKTLGDSVKAVKMRSNTLASDTRRRFVIAQYRTRLRITFQVSRDDTGLWIIRESERVAMPP